MNREETGVLLAYAAGLDSRMHTVDATQAEFTRRSWANALEPVPIEFALDQVTRYYRREADKPLKPAPILIAWRNYERTEAAKETSVGVLPAGLAPKAPGWFRAYAAACAGVWKEARTQQRGAHWDEARHAAAVAVEDTPRPELREPEFHELKRDERQRDCGTTGCPCPHQECRGGFLDAETQTGAVRRCTWCAEAVEMSRELAPKRKGRR